MAEFSKTVAAPAIDTIQPTALPTNTGSATTDVLSAAQFGLDLYQKVQARDAQQLRLEQDKKVNAATAKILQQQEDLVATGVSGSKLEFRLSQSIREASASLGISELDLRSSVADFRKTTTAEALVKANEAEIKQITQARETLAKNIGYLPPDKVASLDISALSDEDIGSLTLEAYANKSILDSQKAMIDLAKSQATSTSEKRSLAYLQFSDSFIKNTSSEIGRTITRNLGSLDTSDPTQIKESLREVAELKRNLPMLARQHANANGLNLRTDEVQAIVNELNARLDQFTTMLNRSDVKSLGDNLIAEKASEIFFKLDTGTPADKVAANALVISQLTKTPLELSNYNNILAASVRKSVSGGRLIGVKEETDNGIGAQGGTVKEKASAWEYIKKNVQGMFNPDEALVTDEYKDTVTQTVLKNFSGTRREIEEMVSSGGYTALLNGMANPKAKGVWSQEDLEEVQETVVPVIQDITARTISQFLRTSQATQISVGGSTAPEEASAAFNIDLNTLVLTPRGTLARHTQQSRNLNNMLQKTMRALENMGYTQQQIQAFKDDVLISIGIVRTQKEG